MNSDCTYATDGHSRKPRNAATIVSANVWTNARFGPDNISTNTLRRKCSLRSIASTAPNIATHRKDRETISSIQITGYAKT